MNRLALLSVLFVAMPVFAQPAPDHRGELIEKARILARNHYDGDYKKMFSYYDFNRDEKYSRRELILFLKDAKVGNPFTRGAWADGVFLYLDVNRDGYISKQEFLDAFNREKDK